MKKQTRFSLDHYVMFVDFVWHYALVEENKAVVWKDVMSECQPILTEEEKADMRSVQISSLARRYVDHLIKRRRSITPWRVQEFKLNVSEAIGEFIAYTINPDDYQRSCTLRNAKIMANRMAIYFE
jgi:hypothetical protein